MKKEKPLAQDATRGFEINGDTYSPTPRERSTIGGAGLNCRVRNGYGWDPCPMIPKM